MKNSPQRTKDKMRKLYKCQPSPKSKESSPADYGTSFILYKDFRDTMIQMLNELKETRYKKVQRQKLENYTQK